MPVSSTRYTSYIRQIFNTQHPSGFELIMSLCTSFFPASSLSFGSSLCVICIMRSFRNNSASVSVSVGSYLFPGVFRCAFVPGTALRWRFTCFLHWMLPEGGTTDFSFIFHFRFFFNLFLVMIYPVYIFFSSLYVLYVVPIVSSIMAWHRVVYGID